MIRSIEITSAIMVHLKKEAQMMMKVTKLTVEEQTNNGRSLDIVVKSFRVVALLFFNEERI
jgi:hypothetical protein